MTQTQAMQRAPQERVQISGSYTNPDDINRRLTMAKNKCHLIAPATICGTPPPGFEIVFSVVDIDTEMYADEEGVPFWKRGQPVGDDLYHVGGYKEDAKYGLSKAPLAKIEMAAGISWDPDRCRRVDNGSDPHYCHFVAVGVVKNFHGEPRVITGQKQMDLRDGSPAVLAMRDRIFTKGAKKDPGEKGYKTPQELEESFRTQLRDLRMFILEHAETKAKLRATRHGLGVKTSYKKRELKKPFIAAKLSFTGKTDNPVLAQAFATKMADAALAAGNALFGPAPAHVAQPAPVAPMMSAPPPVGAVALDVDDFEPEEYLDQREVVDAPATTAPAVPQSPPNLEKVTFPGGKFKGKPLSEVPEKALLWWSENGEQALHRDAAEWELKRRASEAETEPPADTAPAAPPDVETGLPPGYELGDDGELVPIPGFEG